MGLGKEAFVARRSRVDHRPLCGERCPERQMLADRRLSAGMPAACCLIQRPCLQNGAEGAAGGEGRRRAPVRTGLAYSVGGSAGSRCPTRG